MLSSPETGRRTAEPDKGFFVSAHLQFLERGRLDDCNVFVAIW